MSDKREQLNRIEKKYGVKQEYKTDKEMYDHLEKDVPSLVKLLKICR